MDDPKINQLEIARMPDGGYTVCDGRVFTGHDSRGFALPWPRFAASTIHECFAYIERQMEPALRVAPDGMKMEPGAVNRVG